LSKRPLWRTVGRAVYDISKNTELIGIFGEAFFDTLLKKKMMVKLDNAMCISLNHYYSLKHAVHAWRTLERYNNWCQWGLEPIFEELRRKNVYEVFDEIRKKLSVFIKEIGIVIEDSDRLCTNLRLCGCEICGEKYKPPNLREITLKGAVNNREASWPCPTISVCEKCYERLLEKCTIKKLERTEVFVRKKCLRNFALLWFYCELYGELYGYLKYPDFFAIAKVGNIDFFKSIGAGFSSSSFDFLCIDNNGEKYVIDVKTTNSQIQSTSSIISKELKGKSKYIQLALNQGFRVLLPIVRLEKDWKIVLELVEITQ